jgi:phosphatidylglycerol:prolipoprotein diacylglycerol transferase
MPFVIDVDPVAVWLGPLEIRWYGIGVVAAIAIAYLLVRRETRRRGIPDALVADGAFWVGLAALAGGRALYLVQNELPTLAAMPLHAFEIWHGGLSFLGGLVVGLLALGIYARRHGIGIGHIADAVAPGVALGQAVGHLGCLIGGDSFGVATTLPWAVIYRNPAAMAPLGVPLHPVVVYEAMGLVVLFALLWVGRERLGHLGPGAVAAVYLIGVAILRFGLFYLRDEPEVLAGLKTAQLLSIAIGIAGVAWILRLVGPRARVLRLPVRS